MIKAEQIIKKGNWLKNFFTHRQHPIRIISYTTKYMWLLVIPLAKYLIATKFNFQDWVKANWVDILTISVIFGYAILRWVFVYFELEDDCIIAHTGYFGIAKTRVYFSEMSSMSLCQGYFFRAIHACTLYIDTDAKTLQSADITLDLTTKQAKGIYQLATEHSLKKPTYTFTSKKSTLVIFSLLFSSTLSGVVLVISAIYEAYRVVGREIEQRFLERVNTEIEKTFTAVPKYILIAGIVIAGGWLLSFVANLMRHWNFSCTRGKDCFIIKSGKGAKRRHVLVKNRIYCIDYQQSLLMKIFKICTVSVKCTGYGKRRKEISALIPITTSRLVDKNMKLLMPGLPKMNAEVKTGVFDLGRFLTMPIVFSLVPPVAGLFSVRFFPLWEKEIKTFVLISLIPLIWFCAVKAIAALTTFVGISNDYFTIAYCNWYRFHREYIHVDRISKICVTQNPFQKVSGTCNLIIYPKSETVSPQRIAGLNHKKTVDMLNSGGYTFV